MSLPKGPYTLRYDCRQMGCVPAYRSLHTEIWLQADGLCPCLKVLTHWDMIAFRWVVSHRNKGIASTHMHNNRAYSPVWYLRIHAHEALNFSNEIDTITWLELSRTHIFFTWIQHFNCSVNESLVKCLLQQKNPRNIGWYIRRVSKQVSPRGCQIMNISYSWAERLYCRLMAAQLGLQEKEAVLEAWSTHQRLTREV